MTYISNGLRCVRRVRSVRSFLFFLGSCQAREKEMNALPDDVLLEIISRSSTLQLSRLSQTSKPLANLVYQYLSIMHLQTFTLMMNSITCPRSPSLNMLLRYSAPQTMTNKLGSVLRYTCARCGRKIQDVALCDACPARDPRPLVARRVMTRSQTRRRSS